jgi:hypothetical protein
MKAKVNFQNLSIEQIKALQFTTISAAKKQTGISYLGGINISAKTDHGAKFNISTYIVYLAPADQSGVINTCPMASPECKAACLSNSGRVKLEDLAGLNTIKQCRVNRTQLFFYNRRFYMSWLIAEIAAAKKKAAKQGNIFAVRLNGTSDIKYENIRFEGRTIFEIFPEITFYDYTKVPNRKIQNIPNYTLTFSYTGRNTIDAISVLESGQNVAIVFNTKRGEALPVYWRNFPVLDGDIYDYRPADKLGYVVGLRFKLSAKKEDNEKALKSVFVVNETSPDCVLDKSPVLPF